MGRRKKRKTKKSNRPGFLAAAVKKTFSFTLKILPVVLITALFGGFLFWVKESLHADSFLKVREVQVEPPLALSENRRQDLEARLIGRNILRLDLKQIALDLQKNPLIRSARINREMPSLVKVHVTNRNPVAYIQLAPIGPVGLISEDGMILDTASQSSPSWVTIEAFSLPLKRPAVGEQIRDRGLNEALDFLKAFWRHPVSKRESLTRMTLDRAGHVSATLGTGPEIRLGRRPSSRIGTLEKMMHLLEGEGRAMIEYIDLQFDNVIVKRKQ